VKIQFVVFWVVVRVVWWLKTILSENHAVSASALKIGASTVLPNVAIQLPHYTAQQRRIPGILTFGVVSCTVTEIRVTISEIKHGD
jgi:hypothetical protein